MNFQGKLTLESTPAFWNAFLANSRGLSSRSSPIRVPFSDKPCKSKSTLGDSYHCHCKVQSCKLAQWWWTLNSAQLSLRRKTITWSSEFKMGKFSRALYVLWYINYSLVQRPGGNNLWKLTTWSDCSKQQSEMSNQKLCKKFIQILVLLRAERTANKMHIKKHHTPGIVATPTVLLCWYTVLVQFVSNVLQTFM